MPFLLSRLLYKPEIREFRSFFILLLAVSWIITLGKTELTLYDYASRVALQEVGCCFWLEMSRDSIVRWGAAWTLVTTLWGVSSLTCLSLLICKMGENSRSYLVGLLRELSLKQYLVCVCTLTPSLHLLPFFPPPLTIFSLINVFGFLKEGSTENRTFALFIESELWKPRKQRILEGTLEGIVVASAWLI